MFSYSQPNGRFEVGKKICLSISGHHPETWQPSWSSVYFYFISLIYMKTTDSENETFIQSQMTFFEHETENHSQFGGLIKRLLMT